MRQPTGSFAPTRPSGLLLGIALVASACAAGCAAHTTWPDEPGIAVAVSQSENINAGEAFFNALTAERRSHKLPPPMVTPRYQSELRVFAEDLQAGKLSAPAAHRAIERWGRTAYQRAVATWIIDCTEGSRLYLPSSLVDLPAAVISYAGARFHPVSSPRDQCAVLVVAVKAGQSGDVPNL